MISAEAIYNDGVTARSRNVSIRLTEDALEFAGADTPLVTWPKAGLRTVDYHARDQLMRVTHDSNPQARLMLRDAAFISELQACCKQLRNGHLPRWKTVLTWSLGGLAFLLILGYVMLSFLPEKLAQVMPMSWRVSLGQQLARSFVGHAKQCHSTAADGSIRQLMQVFAEAKPDLPPLSLEIYDLDIVNAFAVPGGKIIIMRGLLKQSDSSSELAGVIAHEIGHAVHRHPETQMVRLVGIDLMSSLLTGGNGSIVTSVAGLAAVLRYSRDAERQADAYAREAMVAAAIDPNGLKSFFEKILKEEAGNKKADPQSSETSNTVKSLTSILSTHPDTAERIKDIAPLPAGMIAKEPLTPPQWEALKSVCS